MGVGVDRNPSLLLPSRNSNLNVYYNYCILLLPFCKFCTIQLRVNSKDCWRRKIESFQWKTCICIWKPVFESLYLKANPRKDVFIQAGRDLKKENTTLIFFREHLPFLIRPFSHTSLLSPFASPFSPPPPPTLISSSSRLRWSQRFKRNLENGNTLAVITRKTDSQTSAFVASVVVVWNARLQTDTGVLYAWRLREKEWKDGRWSLALALHLLETIIVTRKFPSDKKKPWEEKWGGEADSEVHFKKRTCFSFSSIG